MGRLKVNFRGAFVDEDVVVEGLGCAGVCMGCERLLLIEFRPLGLKENDG